MSCLSLPKRLQPINKPFFTNKLQSKLHKLKNSKPIKKSTHLISTSIRSLVSCHHRRRHRRRRMQQQQQQQQLEKSTATIYVDELFSETDSKAKEMKATMQRRPVNTEGIRMEVFEENGGSVKKNKSSEKKSTYDVDDAWKAAVASSPQLRGVDERADEFISKFRTEMKLQKEKSIIDFQEMLARSA